MSLKISPTLLTALLILVPACVSAEGLPVSLVNKGFPRAYGFVFAQNASLDRIERLYPHMRRDVAITRMRFADGLGKPDEYLMQAMKDAVGPRDAPKVDDVMKSTRIRLLNQAQAEKLTIEDAQAFLKIVEARGTGKIEDEFLKPMLIARYYKNPALEYSHGFVQLWTSEGEPKANGVRLSLKIPKSFSSKPGSQPHVINQWTARDGLGRFSLSVQVRRLPRQITKVELDDEFSSSEMKKTQAEYLSEGNRLVGYGRFSHEGLDGFWQDEIRTAERATYIVRAHMRMFMIFNKTTMVQFGCYYGMPPGTSDDDLIKEAALYEETCKQGLNTLVIDKSTLR